MNFNPYGLLMRILQSLEHLLINLFNILNQVLWHGWCPPHCPSRRRMSLFVLHMPGGSLCWFSRSQRCSQGFSLSIFGNQKAVPLQMMGSFLLPAGNCQSGRVWGVIIPSAPFGLSAALFCSVCCGLWKTTRTDDFK